MIFAVLEILVIGITAIAIRGVWFVLQFAFTNEAVSRTIESTLKAFAKTRVKGEILRDLGLGSVLNAAYSTEKNSIVYALILFSICVTIVGIIIKESDNV